MSFPRQHARTRRFTLGRPRGFTVSPDGRRVLFLRSRGPEDPVTDLWGLDVASGDERRLVAAEDLAVTEDDLPPEERARRERAREMSQGIVTYATDRDVTVVAFPLGGRLFTVGADGSGLAEEDRAGPVFDPRPSPSGDRIAYESGGALHVVERGGASRRIAGPAPDEGPTVAWARADFVAAEEMDRTRGFWWSPDGARLAVCRVDESQVPAWHIADPANPDQPATVHRYPAAGTVNPDVRLFVVAVDGDAEPVEVRWDREAFEYLARVRWDERGGLTLLVQSRDQRRWQVLTADPERDATTVVREDHDPFWLELPSGAPAWLEDGRLVLAAPAPDGSSHRLLVGGEPVTPPDVQVARIVDVGPDAVTFVGAGDDPTQRHVWRWQAGTVDRLTTAEGVHEAVASGGTTVVVTDTLDGPPRVTVRHADGEHPVRVDTAEPLVTPRVELLELGHRRLRAALLRPTDDPGGPLPVLLDPYGGPHAGERVIRAQNRFLTSQWFADQGFAVLVVDGRGTPNRGPAWEREVHHDLATPVLEDQVDALYAAADHEPRLDLDRVAIRGWSFGGYLSALAVLRRPDVFRAGIAGAPVTDWRLYDTHYTERYLGHPDEHPDAYRVSSLVDADLALVDPAPLPDDRPEPRLLVIHGLADDNVVAAHALRLSHALLAAGRSHRFLPLSGVTHMTPQEVVAENLLLLQLAFLRESLA